MEIGTLILLALLTSLDSFYGGIIYRRGWGLISLNELLIILLTNLLLVSLASLLGKAILGLVGARIAKLISIMLLGIISLLFSTVIQQSNGLEDKFKVKIILKSLGIDNLNERLTVLINLKIMTTIDLVLISFIAIVLTSNILSSIVIFSCVDLLFLKIGNSALVNFL